MSTETINLTPELYKYLLAISVHEPKVLAALRMETRQLPGYQMQISPEQGQFISLLLKLMNAKTVLEIGTFTGYSALVMALALPANGCLVTCDINHQATDVAKRYWRQAGVDQKIELKLGEAAHTLDAMIKSGKKEIFDFIFIDADKQNNKRYFEQSLTLLRSGGLIAVDNVLWGGRVAYDYVQDDTTRSIRQFNQHCFEDSRVEISVVPISDGMLLARKN